MPASRMIVPIDNSDAVIAIAASKNSHALYHQTVARERPAVSGAGGGIV